MRYDKPLAFTEAKAVLYRQKQERTKEGNQTIMSKIVVKVNGKSYDAVSGRRMDDVIAPVQKPVHVAKTAAPVTETVQKSTHNQTRQAANHAKAHVPQVSHTLMRRAVKKPSTSLKKQVHVQHELAHTSQQAIRVKHTASHIDHARLQRATSVEQNEQVRRFHSPAVVPVTFAELPVQDAPHYAPATEPPVAPPTTSNSPLDMFEQAITNATHYVDVAAHKTHFKKKARRHALAMSAGVLALVFIGGFAAYLNVPKLQVAVAGNVAGVSTKAPDFAAANFVYKGVKAHNDRLVYSFGNELASYQLIEQETNWSASEMIEQVSSIAANGTPNYTVLQSSTTTVYKFSSRHATWVKDGIWYQVHGEQPLSDAQLLVLAQNS